jgi:hypothetical protein
VSRRVEHPPAYLYRLHTPVGELAYVGVTTRLVSDALRDHRNRSRWFDQVDPDLTVATGYASQELADDDRRKMINTERPLFNVHRPASVHYTDATDTELPPRPIPGAPAGLYVPSVSGATAAERFAKRADIADRANAWRPPAARQPGEFRRGDLVRWQSQYETITGELLVANDPQYIIVDEHGSETDTPDGASNLTLLTAVEDRT